MFDKYSGLPERIELLTAGSMGVIDSGGWPKRGCPSATALDEAVAEGSEQTEVPDGGDSRTAIMVCCMLGRDRRGGVVGR